jgi:hypothetical protein
MKIYWIKAQAPRRVLALVKHLGIDAELVEVDAKAGGLKTPDYATLNPNMKAPTLGGWRPGAVGVVGHHGLSLHQGRLGHVAGA